MRLVLLLTLFITALLILSAQNIKFERGLKTYLSKDNKIYSEYLRYTKHFKIRENTFLFLKSEDVTSEEVLEYFEEIKKRIKEIDYVGSVEYIPISRTFAIVSIEIETRDDKKIEDIAKQIERVLNFVPKPMGLNVQKTGSVFLWYEIKREMGKSLGVTMSASTLFMILILFLTFRSVVGSRYAFLPLLISILSVIYVFGLMPILGIPMTELTHGALPILIGLCIDYAVQFQSRYEEEKWRGIHEAINIARKRTGLAIFLSLLTSVLCFTSMSFSGVPGLGYFGLLLSLGLIIAFILTLTFLPSILSFDKYCRKISGENKERILKIFADLSLSKSRVVVSIAVMLLILGAILSTQIGMEIQHRKYAPQDLEAVRLFDELERITGQSTYVIVTSENINESYLKFRVERVEYSGNLKSIYISTKLEDYEDYVRMYNEIRSYLKFLGFKEFYVTGDPVLDMEIGRLMIEGQQKITLICYFLIFALLLAIYRSIKKALIPLLPITTVIGAMNILMFSLGMKHTMMSITLNSIIIGLGIDYSIHMIERYYEERKKLDAVRAIEKTVERIGRAISVSALTTAAGFFALMFSDFPIAKSAGFLSFVAIILCLIAAITVVPAFLIITERLNTRSR